MGIKPFDECYFENFNEYEDIKLYEIGGYQCPPRYHYGPVVRDNYVLHYIVDGEGFLRMHGNSVSFISLYDSECSPPASNRLAGGRNPSVHSESHSLYLPEVRRTDTNSGPRRVLRTEPLLSDKTF